VTELVEVTNFFVWRLSNFFLYSWLTLDFFKVMSKQNFNKQKGFSTFTPPHLLIICGQTNVTVKRLKTVFAVLTMLFIMTLSSLTTLKAQGCTWTFTNRLDCSLNITLAKFCSSPPVTVIASGSVTPSSWISPHTLPLIVNDVDLCGSSVDCSYPSGCTIKISFDGGSTYLNDGDMYCCNTGSTDPCIGCGVLIFDCINHTIDMTKPAGCP
jgi:hypothetical protein